MLICLEIARQFVVSLVSGVNLDKRVAYVQRGQNRPHVRLNICQELSDSIEVVGLITNLIGISLDPRNNPISQTRAYGLYSISKVVIP